MDDTELALTYNELVWIREKEKEAQQQNKNINA